MVLCLEKSEADGGVATSADDCAVVRDEAEGTRNAERLGVAAKLASEPSESSGCEVEAFEMSKAPDIMPLLRWVRRAAERRRPSSSSTKRTRRAARQHVLNIQVTCPDLAVRALTLHCYILLSPPWLSWLERRSHIFDVSGLRPCNPEVASSSLAGGIAAFTLRDCI